MFLSFLGFVAVFGADARVDTTARCYDFAIVGRIVRAGDIVAFGEPYLIARLGGLWSADSALDGKSRKLSWMLVTSGGVPVRTARFLMLARAGGGRLPEVIHLQPLATRADRRRWRQRLRAAGLHRCAN